MRSRAALASVVVHGGLFLMLSSSWSSRHPVDADRERSERRPLLWRGVGSGSPGGGGSGGADGERPTPSRAPATLSAKSDGRVREAPLGARLLALAFASDWNVNVPDDPVETDPLFEAPFFLQAEPDPGLLLFGAREIPGSPPARSAGEGGGAGGNRGRGLGPGLGNGVGSGGPRGCCEGAFRAASLDREPVLVFKPADPAYPPEARARGVRGEVILQIVVRADGSTVVEKVLRSLPYCTGIARELAEHYRFEPGLKDGRPVDTLGILIVHFDLVSTAQP